MLNLLSASDVFKTIGSVALALVILLAMVTIHEFGHYIAGKIFKFKIDEFSIGFGPALFKRKNKKTGEQFSVRLLPLGGYCAFAGEEGEIEEAPTVEKREESLAVADPNDTDLFAGEKPKEKNSEQTAKNTDPNLFPNKAPWKRIIVLFAGAFMNYVLAMVFIFVLFFSFGQSEYKVYETAEQPTAPVEYCLQKDDIITRINGKNVYIITDYISLLNGKKTGDKVAFTVIRNGETTDTEIILQADAEFVNLSDTNTLLSAIGVQSMGGTTVRFGFFSMIGRSFVYSFKIGGSILESLGELLTGKLGLDAVGGPISTIQITGQIASQGFSSFLQIAAYIGVNLAVFNLLPIPALDGSKIVLTVIEWIRRKPLNRKVEAIINTVGFILIFGFAILVDILKFI